MSPQFPHRRRDDVRLARDLQLFHFYRLLSTSYLFLPVLITFFVSRGLDFTHIALLNSVYALTAIVFEVPTGALADRFGRCRAMMLGSLLMAIGCVVDFNGRDFWTFALGEGLLALGMTLTSGADSAYLYDLLLVVRPRARVSPLRRLGDGGQAHRRRGRARRRRLRRARLAGGDLRRDLVRVRRGRARGHDDARAAHPARRRLRLPTRHRTRRARGGDAAAAALRRRLQRARLHAPARGAELPVPAVLERRGRRHRRRRHRARGAVGDRRRRRAAHRGGAAAPRRDWPGVEPAAGAGGVSSC